MTKKTLLLDVDGCIADCSSPVHSFAQNLLGRELPLPSTWAAWDHVEAMGLNPEEAELFHTSIKRSYVADFIDLYEGADASVRRLIEAFDLVFVTAQWRQYDAWVPARERLLEPFGRPVIFTHEKWRVQGQILCDDNPDNLVRGDFCPILFDATHNQSSEIQRIFSLDELLPLK